MDAFDKMRGAAIAQVVAVDAGDDDVRELQRGDRFGEVPRLLRVGRKRPAVRDVAERAAARADVSQDHEGRGALAEALGDVGAGRLFAHGVQLLLPKNAFYFME